MIKEKTFLTCGLSLSFDKIIVEFCVLLMFFLWFVNCIERIFAMVYNVRHSHHCSSCNLQNKQKNSIHMAKLSRTKLHAVNFNDVVLP